MNPIVYQNNGNYGLVDRSYGGMPLLECKYPRGLFYFYKNRWNHEILENNCFYLPDLNGMGKGVRIKILGKGISLTINKKEWNIHFGFMVDPKRFHFLRIPKGFVLTYSAYTNGSSLYILRYNDNYIKMFKISTELLKQDARFVNNFLIFNEFNHKNSIAIDLLNSCRVFTMPYVSLLDHQLKDYLIKLQYLNKSFTIPCVLRNCGNLNGSSVFSLDFRCMKNADLLPYIPIKDEKMKKQYAQFNMMLSIPLNCNIDDYLVSNPFRNLSQQAFLYYLSGKLNKRFLWELQ